MKGSPEIRLSSAAGLPQQVAEHLTGEIRGGVLKLGQKLPPEADLCKQYGVSRTVIREAASNHLQNAAKRAGVRIYHQL